MKKYLLFSLLSLLFLAACSGTGGDGQYVPTPTVDYIETLDVYSAPHKDSFLNHLAMNYRSYAIYNARTSGYSEMGEIFAQKAVAAFSGETPFPETLDNWPVEDKDLSFELYTAYNDLLGRLKSDAADSHPELAAEAQAKFDCWLSASASSQTATANECMVRFNKVLAALRDCDNGKMVGKTATRNPILVAKETSRSVVSKETRAQAYYPETRRMSAMSRGGQAREGMIVVNNVNIPEHLINPVPVQPMVFNQNIYGGDKSGNDFDDQAPVIDEELVSREEFINMMMALRAELKAINARLDGIETSVGERMMLKVQQIPLEPKQHVMEEIFEIRFDFNKSAIKPEYQELIRKLAAACQENKNIKVSIVGHTDTMGGDDYNFALGGRRADSVQKMLVKYGIPASQIVAVSAGKRDNKVPTGDQVKNAENRRVRVVKEVHYTEPAKPAPISLQVEGYSARECDVYGCEGLK